MAAPRPFLTARWHDLVLLNYEVPAALLEPLVPAGTSLDAHDGRLFASVVGFRFLDTRIKGIPIPFHRAFEEVNLRFYVRRDLGAETRRAVVFVRELVPKRAVAWIARMAYNEPYRRVPMGHRIGLRDGLGPVEYSWRHAGVDHRLGGRVDQSPAALARPSTAEFITEHYWGYTRQRDGSTLEYRVDHPSWDVAELCDPHFSGSVDRLYGPSWAGILERAPHSAFYAVGSAVTVSAGQPLT